MSISDAIKLMDGDPGLPEITGRLPAAANKNTPEARATLTKLVTDIATAAHEILQRYGEQPISRPQLERLQHAERQAPEAARSLSNIIGPALPTKATTAREDQAHEIKPVRILRALAVSLPTSSTNPHV